jgi:hypothetical protein
MGNRSTVVESSADRNNGRILQFRPRSRPAASERWSPVDDLHRYERPRDDDYAHRMLMNLIAAAVVVILVGCGLWLTDMIVQLRKYQDCALTGRRNCVQITVPVDAR